MKYAILVYETPETIADRERPERAGPYWGAYAAYLQALNQAGVMAGGAGLEPSLTTTVRVRDGRREVQDGPFVDTKEILGGMFIVDVPDLDAALEWAARCPAASATAVEVRPVLVPNAPMAAAGAGRAPAGVA